MRPALSLAANSNLVSRHFTGSPSQNCCRKAVVTSYPG